MARIYGGRSKYLIKNDLKFFAIGDFIIPVLCMLLFYCVIKIAMNLINLKINSYIPTIIIFALIFCIKKFRNNVFKIQKISRQISNNFYYG